MYMSRVQIATDDRVKMKQLTHVGAYHDWVERSFPDEFAKSVRKRHLWRIDVVHGKTYLLIVSEDKPTITGLERYGVLGTAMVKNYDSFLASLQNGMRLRFKLVTTPSYKAPKSDPHGNGGKILSRRSISGQEAWLDKRAHQTGVTWLQRDVTGEQQVVLHRDRFVKMSQVTYEGILQIDDVEALRKVMINGVGRERAFGMGLLTVML